MQLSDSLQEQLAKKLGDTSPQDAPADESTLARVARLVEKLSGFEAQEVQREHTAEQLGLDSLDRIELVVRLEQETGVRLDAEDVADLSTVGALAEYVDKRA